MTEDQINWILKKADGVALAKAIKQALNMTFGINDVAKTDNTCDKTNLIK